MSISSTQRSICENFKNSSVFRTVKVHAANRLLRLGLDEEEVSIDTESITGRTDLLNTVGNLKRGMLFQRGYLNAL